MSRGWKNFARITIKSGAPILFLYGLTRVGMYVSDQHFQQYQHETQIQQNAFDQKEAYEKGPIRQHQMKKMFEEAGIKTKE